MANDLYDVTIIGSGPAGLSASIYTSRARLRTVLFENYSPAPQAILTDIIENYPGFPDGIKGYDLIGKMKKQSEKFGTEINAAFVKEIKPEISGNRKIFHLITENKIYDSLAVIIAAGSKFKELGVEGEDRLASQGISYCAICDGALFKNKDIVVVGGGDSALQETLFLAKFAKKITLLHRRERLRAAKILQEKIFAEPKIEFLPESVIEKISGKNKVESVKINNIKTGVKTELPCDGVFIFIGWTPNTEFVKGFINMDAAGYIITGTDMNTSVEGIFACGDCRVTPLKQIVTACGDGAIAAYSAQQYIDKIKGTEYK